MVHKLIRNTKAARRKIYGLRRFIPWMREIHELEQMVGPLGFWNELQSYQLNTLQLNGLKPEHSLLDIGCGPLQGGLAFIRYLNEAKYHGVDIKKQNIEAGLKQIYKHDLLHKNPIVLYSDSFGLQELPSNKFDFMWASQIMYYFDKEKLNLLFTRVSLGLSEGGKFLCDIIGPEHYEFRTNEHQWHLYTLDSIKFIAIQHGLKVQVLGRIEDFGYPKRLSLRSNLLLEITK